VLDALHPLPDLALLSWWPMERILYIAKMLAGFAVAIYVVAA
jgi:hypothetical protein